MLVVVSLGGGHGAEEVRRVWGVGAPHEAERLEVRCDEDRRVLQCNHPEICAATAQQVVQQLLPKWDPRVKPTRDELTLTRRRKKRNLKHIRRRKGVLFDPTVTTRGEISETFRVFTDLDQLSEMPAHRPDGGPSEYERVTVHTDGSCLDNGTENARCGSGIYFGQNDDRNTAVRVPGSALTNQIGEIVAVMVAALLAPQNAWLDLVTDSDYVMKGLTEHLQRWDDIGWIGVENAELFKDAAARLRARTATTAFKWVKGHSGVPGNEAADKLAKAGADMNPNEAPDLQLLCRLWMQSFTKTAAHPLQPKSELYTI